jgi:hypothetical protein
VLAHRCHASFLVAVHTCHAIGRHFLRVVAVRPDTKWLVSCIGENIETWPHDQVDAAGGDFLGSSFGHFISQISRSSRCKTHRRGVLADVNVVKQAVDAAVFLVETD